MKARFIEWIWHITGSVKLAADQSSDAAFDRLEPLFQEYGTTHERSGDMLTFHKKDQAAQDKMSIFDDGVLRIERGQGSPVLRYRLTSRMLLFCFLAPILFLAIAQFTIVLGKWQQPSSEAAQAAKAKAAAAAKKPPIPLNPIDKALGAPEPEKKKVPDKPDDKKPSPTAAYVFAAIFAALYVVGRILEDRLIKSVFRKRLLAR